MSESEQLMVVDSTGQPLYPATREKIHREGMWHETFHCFVINHEEGHVILQQRAKQKKDFPGLIDITAAGHLLAGETPRDGIRELEEEIGLVRQFEQLFPLGVFLEELILGDLKDRERVHLFLTDSGQDHFTVALCHPYLAAALAPVKDRNLDAYLHNLIIKQVPVG